MSETKEQGKHTPGPWDFVRVGKNIVIRNSNGGNVADISFADEVDEANARLIAAAPELLEALKTIIDAWLSPLETRALKVQMCEDARAAIGKAEGH